MAKVFIEESNLTAIGEAIRSKTGKSELLSPASMASEIESITTGGGAAEPTIGYVVESWDTQGRPTSVRTVGLTTLPDRYFCYNNTGAEHCTYTLNEGITTLGQYSFNQLASDSATINLPSTLTTLGTRCFNTMKCITEHLVIPAGVTEIPSNTFQSSAGLQKVTLLGDIKTINTYAFASCSQLKALVMPNITGFVTLVNINAFNSTNNLSIYIPDEWVTKFQGATNWSSSSVASKIKPISALEVQYGNS